MTDTLASKMKEVACRTEEKIKAWLNSGDPHIASTYEAMLYSALAGGKRIRPFLCVAVAEMLGGDREVALTYGAALEMIHTYSLIHDDLPAMDNDDLRRGKPTCHKVYGEAVAILAGDGLLTEAFGLLSSANASPELVLEGVRVLSRAAGAYGMIGGQTMDILAETTPLSSAVEQKKLCDKKTGALISVAGRLGCLAAGHKDDEITSAILTYTQNIGLVFQMIDDYLDVFAGEEQLGKPIGSDAANGKTTFMSWMSPEQLLAEAKTLTDAACASISSLEGSDTLIELAQNLLVRQH